MHRPDQSRVSVGDDDYHRTGECYRCVVCMKPLSGRKVSRPGPGSLVCSSVCYSSLNSSSSSRRVSVSESDSRASYLREWKPIPRLENYKVLSE